MRKRVFRGLLWAGRVVVALGRMVLAMTGRGLVRAPGAAVQAMRWLATR